jgi:hypothetical protein
MSRLNRPAGPRRCGEESGAAVLPRPPSGGPGAGSSAATPAG